MDVDMLHRMRDGTGFVAALDQSAGSTPRTLRLYGIDDSEWIHEESMLDLIHRMRERVVTSPVFDGDRILAVILFEGTMDRSFDGVGAAEYLWQKKSVVPFLKVDRGLEDEMHGVRLMKPIPGLDEVLQRARGHGVFGTKMRSVVLLADRDGITRIVDQQLELALRIHDAGLLPIVEPEVAITSPQKEAAEDLLVQTLHDRLDELPPDREVMLKLTLPEQPGLLDPLVAHPRVVRVAALSGGYDRAEACRRLADQHGVIASFSRALLEGLDVHQSDAEFDAVLHGSIESIYRASIT